MNADIYYVYRSKIDKRMKSPKVGFSVNVVLAWFSILGRTFQFLLRSINYSIFSITSSILAMIVLFLYSRESVLVSYESHDVPVVPLPTGQEIFTHHSKFFNQS